MKKINEFVRQLVVLLTIMVLFTGCALITNSYEPPGARRQLEEHTKRQEQAHQGLQQYIGMTKEQIRAEWGKPNKIMHDIEYLVHFDYNKDKCKYRTADEVWVYEDWGPIPFLATSGPEGGWFYFIDGVVVKTKP